MNKGKCLIISGGELKNPGDYLGIIHDAEYVIAADGGARHTPVLGLKPQLVVGDFDSLTEDELEYFRNTGVEIEYYPPVKDYSDTHLAILMALERGYEDITIIAALGGRIDHTLANIMLLALPEARRANLRIWDEGQEIRLVTEELKLEGQPGTIISLLPLSETVHGVVTEGLEYKVPQETFRMGVPNGISNVMTGEKASVQVKDGLLLAIINHKKGE